jgi:hypothetical protein
MHFCELKWLKPLAAIIIFTNLPPLLRIFSGFSPDMAADPLCGSAAAVRPSPPGARPEW